MELWQLDATEIARLIRLGRISAMDATASVMARMDQVNPRLNAVVRRFDDEARSMAHAADLKQRRGDVLGPLHGVPVTTKVNVDQAGHPNDNGVIAFKDAIAVEDSPVVANLRRAGAILIGRTNTPSFSMRVVTENPLHGRTLNPRDLATSPGGSSGGAGSAVAAGIGPIAHANDIGGSVRIPAYCCGVVGMRPGLGRVPAFNPSQPVARPVGSQLMAVQGSLTRSVRDARLALTVMAWGDARDTRWADVPLQGPAPKRPIRVALVPEPPGGLTHPAQAAAVRQAGRHLAAAGYAVEETMPPDIALAAELWHRIGIGDVLRTLWPRVQELGDASTRSSMQFWLDLLPAWGPQDALAALADRDLLLQRWQTFFIDTPLVVMPTLADLPPEQDVDLTRNGQARVLDSLRTCLVAPVLGIPALALPVGSFGALRTGVQLMAARFRDDLCLDAAEAIEAAEGVVAPIDPTF